MKENTNVPFLPAGRLYLPSASVEVPDEVPFTRMDTPGSDWPSLPAVTLPEIVCANAGVLIISMTISLSKFCAIGIVDKMDY
ncbi:hypothetical protein GCM10027423_31300 [Spirosoma arcticum]